MKVSLIRTGGILPVIKKAETELNLDDKEFDELINKIKASDSAGAMRDATQFQIEYKDKKILIDIEKVPIEYIKVFEDLKNNLQIVKPN